MSIDNYHDFLTSKSQFTGSYGFEPVWMPDGLYDFQRSLVDWSVRRGKAAIFADCGLGKTFMQLAWAENVVRHMNKPVLILTPISVAKQTLSEAAKLGVEAVRSQDGRFPSGARIVVTNYERLHYFNPDLFGGVVCDESSILKNFEGETKAAVTEFLRTRPFRLLCTATAAPNDYLEMGTSSEALGELGYLDMRTKFFREKQDDSRGLRWGFRTFELRPHAERDFWRWVVSWARAIRKPSDLGFDDGRYLLPELVTREHIVPSAFRRPGQLFEMPAISMPEQKQEARKTLQQRCELVAGLVANTGKPAVSWCQLNDESTLLAKLISDSEEITGSTPDERKEELYEAFSSGQLRVLVTKPTIAGFGLNWQHCGHQTFFPSHSFEQWYQAIRRSYRFGRDEPVTVDMVTSEGLKGVLENLQRKERLAAAMFARLVELMNDSLRIQRVVPHQNRMEVPAWL
jgi:hypothetical protein